MNRKEIIERAIIFSKTLDGRMKDANLLKEAKNFSKKLSRCDNPYEVYGDKHLNAKFEKTKKFKND